MLRAICTERAALGEEKGRRHRAETKPPGPPASKRLYEPECSVKETEGFTRRRGGGQAPWMPWKQRGERMSGSKKGDGSSAMPKAAEDSRRYGRRSPLSPSLLQNPTLCSVL